MICLVLPNETHARWSFDARSLRLSRVMVQPSMSMSMVTVLTTYHGSPYALSAATRQFIE